jgi:hypothetical protein
MQTPCDIRANLTNVHAVHGACEPAVHPTRRPDSALDSEASEPVAADAIFESVDSPKLVDLVELILKDRPGLEKIIRDPALAGELVPRFLAVSLLGFTLFGAALALVMHAVGVHPQLASIKNLLDGREITLIGFATLSDSAGNALLTSLVAALQLIAAYDLGLIAAAGVCLPSLYFYGLLAGVPMSMARVTVHTVKAMSTTAVALVGILPIYMAFSLGAAIFHAPRAYSDSILWLGLILPFAAGLFGARSLYEGFTRLTDVLPAERRYKRTCFLRRLVVSWSVCYAAVTPVMIYTLWECFSRVY